VKTIKKGGINESVVLIGGGGGVYRIARFLKHIRPNITTIQTMFDHGGHSGELRDERGVLPPGDIRQAILALADEDIEADLRALLAHRFAKNGSSLDGATVGNILLTALAEITGSTVSAIQVLSRWFKVKGKVLPVSLDNSELCAELNDGVVLKGENKIDLRSPKDHRTIKKVFLSEQAHLYVEAGEAIRNADKIVFCPGDLYTSLIPNALVEGFREALVESKAKLIYVVNLMTKKAETDGFTASDFSKTLLKYIGRKNFFAILCNSGKFKKDILISYAKQGAYPVDADIKADGILAERIVEDDFIDDKGGILRHSQKVASVIAGL
jgi:uncharacterized cofD-like protein